MRLPVRKPYRAFAELDGFTNAECRRLVDRAIRHHRSAAVIVGLLTACFYLAGISLFFGTMFLCLAESSGRRPRDSQFARFVLDVVEWGPGLVLVSGVVGSFALALIPHVWLVDRLAVRSISELLRRTNCPDCGRSLLGCSRTDKRAVCMQCGRGWDMRSLKIESADLGPPLIARETKAVCERCGYALDGLPVHRGLLVCPECGQRAPVAGEGTPIDQGGGA